MSSSNHQNDLTSPVKCQAAFDLFDNRRQDVKMSS